MYIDGLCILVKDPAFPELKLVKETFTATKNGWSITIEKGTQTDGASIPWPFTIWLDKYDEDYITAAVVHDALVGQFTKPVPVFDDRGKERILTWKEAAVWLRAIMKADQDNNKLIRRVFYHSVMLYKRFHNLF
jgi:hypothetical protein